MNTSTILGRLVLVVGFAAWPLMAQAQEAAPQPPPAPQTPPTTPAPLGSRSTVVEPPPGPVTAPVVVPKSNKPFVRVFRPFRVRLGVLLPTQNSTRDDIDSGIFSFGLSLDLGQTRGLRPTVITTYVDGVYGQNQDHGPVNRLVSVGIGVSARNYLTPPRSSARPYIGLGLGVYSVSGKFDHLEAPTATIGNVTVSRLRYVATDALRTNFGGKIFAGAEWSERVFGELAFTAAGSTNDYSPTGVNLSAGVRF